MQSQQNEGCLDARNSLQVEGCPYASVPGSNIKWDISATVVQQVFKAKINRSTNL